MINMALRLMFFGNRLRKIFDSNKRVALQNSFNRNIWNHSYISSSSRNYLHQYHGSLTPRFTQGDCRNIQVRTYKELHACTRIYKGAQTDEWIITLAKFAVDKHNENQDTHLQFVRVVGASHSGVSSLLYHITLEATEANRHKIYHIVVWLQLWRNFMELLVWKRVNDALSAFGVKLGDLKLHETVMFYMNDVKKDLPQN